MKLRMYYHNIISFICITIVFIISAGCSTPQTQLASGVSQEPELTQIEFFANDGYRIPIVQSWPAMAPEGIVVALHGFNDYSKAFEAMCQFMVKQKMACIAYDQRGFGATDMTGIWPEDGRLQYDLYLLTKMIHEKHPQLPIFLVGESMGGAVILTAMADLRFTLADHVKGALLYAPAVWARTTQPWYQRLLLWLAVHTFPGWTPTGEGLGIQATDNIEALRAMGRDSNIIKATRIDTIYGLTNLMDAALASSKDVSIQTLVLYGDNDQVIPKEPTCKMLEKMKVAKQKISFINYSEGYHMLSRDLQAERVFIDSINWMKFSQQKGLSLNVTDVTQVHSLDYCLEFQN